MLAIQALADLVVVLISCAIAYSLGMALGSITDGVEVATVVVGERSMQSTYISLSVLTAIVSLLSFRGCGLYSPTKSLLNVEEYKNIAKSVLVSFVVFFTLLVFLRSSDQDLNVPFFGAISWFHNLVDLEIKLESISRLTILISFVLILVLMTINRFVTFKLIQSLYRRGIGNRNVLIYGTGETGGWLQRKFHLVPTLGLRLVGFVTEHPDEIGNRQLGDLILGTFDDLEDVIEDHKISEVFIALPGSQEERVMEIIAHLDTLGVTFRVVPGFYHLLAQRVRIEHLDSIPLISRPDRSQGMISSFVKRCLDIALASIALLLTAPAFLLACLLINRQKDGPVFYSQSRVGLNGKCFPMLKFRTMFSNMGQDQISPKDEEDPRITPFGKYLRRYSIDELPQLLNVIKGEMSIVGPRPEMAFIVDSYGPLERERLAAKPGITGLWQISFARNEAIHQNIEYDIYYIENRSLLLDLVIIFLTGFAVVKGTGAH
ncbi:MAG: exopolysaccharide biosynthesis polyprenyl glycosylphosphotransferase [Planctomycetota bacterium]|jgi:exopolysaccharide biosynthesis polyprenyl glycosylphosphotransferase